MSNFTIYLSESGTGRIRDNLLPKLASVLNSITGNIAVRNLINAFIPTEDIVVLKFNMPINYVIQTFYLKT